MAKLKIKSAPTAPKPAPAAPQRAGWAYYVIPPLLIIGVFLYCSKHAHKAPAQPAVAAAPAEQPQTEPQTAADNEEPAADEPASAEQDVQEPADAEQDDDFTGGDTATPDTQEEETTEEK